MKKIFTLTMGVLSFFIVFPKLSIAINFQLPAGVSGIVSIEFVSSHAAFTNTLSVVSPVTVGIALPPLLPGQETGTACDVDESKIAGLLGKPIVTEKLDQFGCRVILDSNPTTPSPDPFSTGDVLEFQLCAHRDDGNNDPNCDFLWSSNPSNNSDSVDHVQTVPDTVFPDRVFLLRWEDLPFPSDNDFNDLTVRVRIQGNTPATSLDRDQDGIWDNWEKPLTQGGGVDTDGDGLGDFDIFSLGARINQKDVFVYLDYMDCAVTGHDCTTAHSHRPSTATIQAIKNAFCAGNVSNPSPPPTVPHPDQCPDPTRGISLHVEIGKAVKHENSLNFAMCKDPLSWGRFDVIKEMSFRKTNKRRFVYHYGLLAHQLRNLVDFPNDDTSGCAEVFGNDFIVTLGGWPSVSHPDVGEPDKQMTTIMHELGHNLNLNHGGRDNINYKPNYLSIMNYDFQREGGIPEDSDGINGPETRKLDYSRMALPALNENALNETAGIQDSTFYTFYRCTDTNSRIRTPGNLPINWNCTTPSDENPVSGDIGQDSARNGGSVCVDPGGNRTLDTTKNGDDIIVNDAINGDRIEPGPNNICDTNEVVSLGGDDILLATLVSYNDWNNLKLNLQDSRDFEDGVHTSVIELEELTFTTASPPVADAGSIGDGNPITAPGPPFETYSCLRNEVIQLDGSGSFDPNGEITGYAWDFPGGDPTDATGPQASLICKQEDVGTLNVRLTVTDNDELMTSDFASVDVTGCDCQDPQAILGSSRNDFLKGTPGDDVICAFGGRDHIIAKGGNDCIDAGKGSDHIIGGSGNDLILGGSGSDFIIAGSGADKVFGEAGRDHIIGGRGNDYIDGGNGKDFVLGLSGVDECINVERSIGC